LQHRDGVSLTGRFRSVLPTLSRYAIAIAAPGSVSVAQLMLQLALLHTVGAGEFGTFAFLMVAIQFGYSVSNALIATPYTVVSQRPGFTNDEATIFHTVNLTYCLAFGAGSALLATALGGGAWVAYFALYATAAMVRWFGRAHAFANFRNWRVALSDITYAAALVLPATVLWLTGMLSMTAAALVLLGATVAGLAIIGPQFLRAQLRLATLKNLVAYREVWRDQARWTLLGVATTEATSNAHSYLVTAFAGPSAFAPLAAASFFVKPLALTITSLTQLERPVMSRAVNAGDTLRAMATRRNFQVALALAWLVTVSATALILWRWPGLVVRPGYGWHDILIAAALFSLIAASQAVQAPSSVLLQAAGQFPLLAKFSLNACSISIIGGAALLWLAGPVWSLAGICAGQLLMTWQIARHVLAWSKDHG
jgi:O-antigen/teichoic acid export membrane protein